MKTEKDEIPYSAIVGGVLFLFALWFATRPEGYFPSVHGSPEGFWETVYWFWAKKPYCWAVVTGSATWAIFALLDPANDVDARSQSETVISAFILFGGIVLTIGLVVVGFAADWVEGFFKMKF